MKREIETNNNNRSVRGHNGMEKMKRHSYIRIIGLAVISILCIIPTLTVFGQETATTLTVKKIFVEFSSITSKYNVIEIEMTDEAGNTVMLYANKWFENISEQSVTFPVKFSVVPGIRGNNIYLTLDDEAKLLWEFEVSDKTYLAGFGTGSKLAVRKSAEGKYTLFSEETVSLSPPPPSEK